MNRKELPGYQILKRVVHRARKFADVESHTRDVVFSGFVAAQFAQLRSEITSLSAEQELLVERMDRLSDRIEFLLRELKAPSDRTQKAQRTTARGPAVV